MQKFGAISRWQSIKALEPVKFHGDKTRRIRLEVSTPAQTEFVLKKKGAGHFLALTSGRDVLEFVVEAGEPFKVTASNDIVVNNYEDLTVHLEESGKPKLTKAYEPKPRNAELEMVAMKAAENATKRMREINDKNESRMRKLEEDLRVAVNEDQRASNQSDAQETSTQGQGQVEPAPPASESSALEQSGGPDG